MWGAACYLTRCSAGVSPDDPNYNQLKEWEILGASCVREIEVLIGNISFTADGYDNYSRIKDALSRNEKYINGYGAGGAKVATGLIGATSGMGLVVAGGEASVASGGASLVLSGIGFWMIDYSVNEAKYGLNQISNTYNGYEYQYGDRVLSAFSSHDNSIYFNPLKDTADFVGKAAFEMAVSVIGFKLAKLVDKAYELGKPFIYGKNASANQFSGKIEQPKVQKPKGNDKPGTTSKGSDKPNNAPASNAGKGKIEIEEGAKPNADELRAGEGLSQHGYNGKFQQTLSDKGIDGLPKADLHVEGLGQIDVYTPKTKNVESILRTIERKRTQGNGVFVQGDFSNEQMQSFASRLWGKPTCKHMDTLIFQDSNNVIHFFRRPK